MAFLFKFKSASQFYVQRSYSCKGEFLVTEHELLRLHIEAVWNLMLPTIDEVSDEVTVMQGTPPWSLYIGRFAHKQVNIWHTSLPIDQRKQLLTYAQQAKITWEETLKMRYEVIFQPPHIFPQQQAQAQQIARILTTDDADLIDIFEPGSAPYYLDPNTAPCIGVIIEDQLLSIAHSSRQTMAACELGIDTLPEARCRGYATAATILWTTTVQQASKVPIYSAFAENIASLHLAKTVGYLPCIDGVYGPIAESAE
jgi:RimJ/RimL family protein N-acetyltransferase